MNRHEQELIIPPLRANFITVLRTIFIDTWIVLATIFFGTATILSSYFDSSGKTPHLVARAWARSILFASRVKVVVKGMENIDPEASYIYMPNHQSYFDIPVLLGKLEVQFRWLAKSELFKIPIFGRAMKNCGYISIDRSNQASAFKSIEQAGQTIQNDRISVIIFPEGTRSNDGRIGSYKKGGFVLATDLKIPIVPIIIHGTRPILPKGKFMMRPQDVVLQIGKPIDTRKYTRENKEELMDVVRQVMVDNFKAQY